MNNLFGVYRKFYSHYCCGAIHCDVVATNRIVNRVDDIAEITAAEDFTVMLG